jgi:hypothetical protein
LDTIITFFTDSIAWLNTAIREGRVSRTLAGLIVGVPLVIGLVVGLWRAGLLGLLVWGLLGFIAGAAILYGLAKSREGGREE